MYQPSTILICLLISQLLFTQKKENEEPLITFTLEVNGEKHNIKDGQSLLINGNKIKVKSSNVKTFDFGSLTFDYPRHFAFEFTKEDEFKNWTLDGNSFVITYFKYELDVSLEAFVSEMVQLFKEENCEVVDKEIKFGDSTYFGKRILISLFGEKLTYDIYEIETDDLQTHLIGFQDSKNDDGSDSKEGINTIRLIDESIKIK